MNVPSKVSHLQSLRLSTPVLAVALPLMAAAFVLITNGMVPFSNDGHCDPWHYFGYFYLDDRFAMMGDSRTYSRLPSTLLGFALSRLLPSTFPDYANFIALMTLIVGPIFFVADRMFGRLPAIVAALFVATSGIVIGNLSVTYTGPALAWSTIAMAFALMSTLPAMAENARRSLLILAGFFWGAALMAHLYSLTYNFVLPLYATAWLQVRPQALVRRWLVVLLHLLSGVLLSVVAFALVSKLLLHAEWTFFRHQFVEVFGVNVADYRKPSWYAQGGKLALLVLGAALPALALSGLGSISGGRRQQLLSVAIPMLSLTGAQVIYTALGGITLEYDYYYVWLVPNLALALAAVLSRIEFPKRGMLLYSAGGALLLLASTLAGYDTLISVRPAVPSLLFALAVVVVLALLIRAPMAILTVALFVGLAGLSATIRPERMGTQLWDGSTGGDAMYHRLRDGWDFLRGQHFQARPKFWLDASDELSETRAYARGFENCHIDTALPKFMSRDDDDYDARAETWEAGDSLVLAVRNDRSLETALANLRQQRRLLFDQVARKAISWRGVSYELVVGRLRAAEQ